MKNLPLSTLIVGLLLGGCGAGSETEMTKTEEKKMDTLFRGGIKNTPDAAPGSRGSANTPVNAADK